MRNRQCRKSNYLRHVRFEKPVVVKMDGKNEVGSGLDAGDLRWCLIYFIYPLFL